MLKVMKENIDEIMKWANLLFLFLFSLHLYNFPDKFIILWCGFSMLVFVMQHKKLCLDRIFWVLALAIILNGLGTYYYLRENLSYTWANILKMVVPTILVYPFMKQVVWNKKNADIEKVILAIALGTFLYSLLNYYSYIIHGYTTEDRVWSEFWTLYPQRATHHSYWGCFIVGLGGYGLYSLLDKKWFRGISILFFIIIENLIQIAVDNRMILCISIVSLFVSFLLFLYLNISEKEKVKKILGSVLIAVVVAFLLIAIDFLGIRSSAYYRNFVTRDGGIINNIRFQMIYEAITLLPSHWKGGATMWTAGCFWVHNYWLQVANVSGIIPFILWMIVNVSALVDVIKVIRSSYIDNGIKFMLVPMISAIVGYLMMEPSGTEANRYIIFYVMLIALLKQVVQNKQKVEIE